jgi:hypothetical protein
MEPIFEALLMGSHTVVLCNKILIDKLMVMWYAWLKALKP